MSIKRKIGAVIVGWFITMIVAIVRGIVKRALAKQAKQAQQARAQAHPQPQARSQYSSAPAQRPVKSQPFKAWAVTDTIYQGMNRNELVAAYGEPAQRGSSSAGEVWIYAPRRLANDNGGSSQPGMTVVLESGIVKSWTEDAA